MTGIGITLRSVTRRYGGKTALDAVSIALEPGSFTALLGASGCGKTTLLRLIAGFEVPDEGSILFDGQLVADAARQVPPEKRGVGVVFQSYALWPHMDVHGNVAYPLTTQGVNRTSADARVTEALQTVGLVGFDERRIDELSGGQRQRVALARCLVAESRIILFDEPLANLDMHLRAAMLEEFRTIHRRTGATVVYVTHDQAEALALAERVVVMDAGEVLQVSPPEELYRSPANARVAGFVGRGSLVAAQAVTDTTVKIAGVLVPARMRSNPRGGCRVVLRPESLSLADAGLEAVVVSSVYRGPVHEVWLKLAGSGETISMDCRAAPVPGATVHVAVSDAWVIPEA